ncbi:MAG: G1 family glutamic endopeptidase [Candidatus Levyibacteriota bacterium]
MKKFRLLYVLFLVLSIFCLTAISTSSHFFPHHAHAQTVVTPTLYCLSAGCPTLAVTKTPSSPSNANEENPTIVTNASPTPNVTTSTTTSFNTTQPCTDSSLTSLTSVQVPAQRGGNAKGRSDNFPGSGRNFGNRDGFLGDFFKYLVMIIDLILKVTGVEDGSLPCSPSLSGDPAASVPEISPETNISGVMSPAVPNNTSPSIPAQKSANWAGYVINTPVSNNASITTTWTATQIDCSGGDGHASSWPGMGGWGSNNSSIAQTGTAEVCTNGSSNYYGWTETFPNPVVPLDAPTHAVKIGDQFTGSITYKGNGTFATTMTDKTQGWTQSMPMTINAFTPRTSEIITESSSDFPIVPKFAAISYPGSIYSPDGTKQNPLSAAPKLVKITNNNESGILRTDTGPIKGDTFTTTWTHN